VSVQCLFGKEVSLQTQLAGHINCRYAHDQYKIKTI
jgi:hypothetical protein